MIEKMIYEKIMHDLEPEILKILDLSHKHVGHLEVQNDKNIETHFKIIIKAIKLNHFSRIAKHKYIYNLIKSEMELIHSLEIEFLN